MIEELERDWKSLLRRNWKDPWSLRIRPLLEECLERVKQELNFRLAGNAALFCSGLLKLRAELLAGGAPFPLEDEKGEEKGWQTKRSSRKRPLEPQDLGFDPLTLLKPKRIVVGKASVQDLLDALSESLKKLMSQEAAFDLKLTKQRLEKLMSSLYRRILEVVGQKGFAVFPTDFCKSREEVLAAFIALLHLWQKGKVEVKQPKLFGELLIKLPSPASRLERPQPSA